MKWLRREQQVAADRISGYVCDHQFLAFAVVDAIEDNRLLGALIMKPDGAPVGHHPHPAGHAAMAYVGAGNG